MVEEGEDERAWKRVEEKGREQKGLLKFGARRLIALALNFVSPVFSKGPNFRLF